MKKTNNTKKSNNIMYTKSYKAKSHKVMARAWELKKQDSTYVWSLCLKMAWDELKANEVAKAEKKANKGAKAPKVVKTEQVFTTEDVAKAIEQTKAGAETTDTLVSKGRQFLIAMMKELHVKGWYRIYDKPTMADRIVAQAA